MFKLEDKNKWTRPIDAEFVDVAGNPRSSSDYDRVWNKPQGWVPPNKRHKSYEPSYWELKQYRKHYFGRFVRLCLYICLAMSIGYKWGANNPTGFEDTRTPVEISQHRAQIACNNLIAYKIAKMPNMPWDVMECAMYKGKNK